MIGDPSVGAGGVQGRKNKREPYWTRYHGTGSRRTTDSGSLVLFLACGRDSGVSAAGVWGLGLKETRQKVGLPSGRLALRNRNNFTGSIHGFEIEATYPSVKLIEFGSQSRSRQPGAKKRKTRGSCEGQGERTGWNAIHRWTDLASRPRKRGATASEQK
ncbi:hypothetical protein CIHG_06008 [Coccidioides immitis H538.4]|uniref:Uncharacterized protein n=2 Tax=Coccidioides immitis TaxID=5501 RepID=A0A0J8RSQ3_COCIT|nr:hypothetical protein CIRG_01757 [Coccidioides immitis RMSCC 2394]KMU87616.1 hypothetical protein CIHG_06008 [Coccidioides immitis H538.4]